MLMFRNDMEYLGYLTSGFADKLPLIISIGAIVFYSLFKYNKYKFKTPVVKNADKTPKLYIKPNIEPVSADFEWDKVTPLKSFPFKNGEYKLTMGIRKLDPQDWLLIEPTYLNRIENKAKIVSNTHPDYPPNKDLASNTVFITEEAIPAIREFYDIVIDYMCVKYPMYFKGAKNGKIFNSITGNYLPARAADESNPRELLIILSNNIEEDFLLLLKDPSKENEKDGMEYFFKAGIFAFAAGFSPKDRFNKPLSFVHHPVPGYETKLKLSMNRFFNRLEPGQFVTRSNFSVQTHHKFYVDDQNKGHQLREGEKQVAIDSSTLDFEKQVHYRSERQALTKLPKSKAVVFTIRTYLLPMSEIKNDDREVRERLIGAIKGLPEDISLYKRAAEWGPAVIEYLLDQK
mmetsp:Transcript_1038/g.1041  ORF Transcript_1038/g.1041 Transcript_1038/m.1041 type:complete len:402 (-) Transcript_1038:42-1247(-)